MIIAKIQISGVQARPLYAKPVPVGLRGGEIELEYSGEIWDGLIRNVVFSNGLSTVGLTNCGRVVPIPPEVLDTRGAHLVAGVCGIDGTGAVVIPTLWAVLGRVRDAVPSDFVEAETGLTPSVAEQILGQIGQMESLKTEDKSSLVAAINEVAAGGDVSEEAIAEAVEDYLTEHPVRVEETDPTVPDWAKQPEKPTYTAEEVGAAPPALHVNHRGLKLSHTFAEILAAYESGAYVDFLGADGYTYYPYIITSEQAYFRHFSASGTQVNTPSARITPDGEVDYIQASCVPVMSVNGKTGTVTLEIPTDDHINDLINQALSKTPNAAEVAY